MLQEIRPAHRSDRRPHPDHRPRLSRWPSPAWPRCCSRYQANGSLIEKDGKVIGSALIGQVFPEDKLLPRPAFGHHHARSERSLQDGPAPYNAANSGGSNLGPTNKALIDRVKEDVAKLKAENPDAPRADRPGDHVGQRPRPAHLARGRSVPGAARCQGAQHGGGPPAPARQPAHRRPHRSGFLGEPRVNVLALNLALDRAAAGG